MSILSLLSQAIGALFGGGTTSIGAGQAQRAGGNAYQAGGDLNVNELPPDPFAAVPWHQRPGAPRVEARPGIERGRDDGTDRLLGNVLIFDANPQPGSVEARWLGAGTDHDWTPGMAQNVRPGEMHIDRQLKPVEIHPTEPEDEVTFEVRFNWGDGQHGATFRWPIRQHEKGHWILDSHLGTGVRTPEYW